MVESFLRESTKFRILDAPIQLPGTCISCGSSDTEGRKYIDLGIDVEWIGAIYFCTICYTEGANALGYLNPEQARNLEEALTAAENHIIEFRTKEKALDDAINLLRSSGLFNSISGLISAVAEGSSNISNENITGTGSETAGTNKHSDKQDSKQGSIDLSATGSDDLFSSLEL
jgi:hypothetical protein